MATQPAQLLPVYPEHWIMDYEYRQLIREIPDTFDYYAHLGMYITSAVEDWLADLIGVDTVNSFTTSFRNSTPLTSTQANLRDYIQPFIVLASWSAYIGTPYVIISDTGPVTKQSDGFTVISATDRNQLSRYYRGEAERWARKLTRLMAETNATCEVFSGSKRPKITSASGKRKSRFC